MAVILANNASARLATAIDDTQTTIDVEAGQGAMFPSPTGGDWFPVTFYAYTGELEVLKCTARSGDTLTVTRAQEGTAARAFNAGEIVELRLTNEALAEIPADMMSVTPTDGSISRSLSDWANSFSATFNTVADMQAATWLYVGQKVKTLGYYAPGDGGGNDYEVVAAGTGTDNGGKWIDHPVTGFQLEGLFPFGIVNFIQFGGVGDSSTNDSSAITNSFIFSSESGLELDGLGKEYASPDFLTINLTGNLKASHGSFIYTGLNEEHYFIKLRTTSSIHLDGLEFHASDLCSKSCHIHPNSTDSEVYLNNCKGVHARQTDTATSVAAGIEVSPESGTFKRCYVTGGEFSDCTSTKTFEGTLTSVGRGLYVSDCRLTEVYGARFERIGPYHDGDGLVVGGNPSIRGDMVFFSDQCTFVDCEKRSIKSQVGHTTIGTVFVQRTQAFPEQDIQREVSLLDSGTVGSIVAKYASGSVPGGIVTFEAPDSGSYFDSSFKVNSITVSAENPLDVIKEIVSFSLNVADVNLDNCGAENINVSCGVNNVARIYTANQTIDDEKFSNLYIRNVSVASFTGNSDSAIFFVTRGSSSYNSHSLILDNIVSRDGYVPYIYYWDTLPGSTSFYTTIIKTVSRTPNRNAREIIEYQGGYRTFAVLAHEGLSKDVVFTIDSSYANFPVMVSYASSRTSSPSKMFTQGQISTGIGETYYLETIAGNKTNAAAGDISINPSAISTDFTVSKTSGSGSTSGFLYITILDTGNIIDVIF